MIKLTFLGTGTSQGVPMIACPCEVCRSTDPRDRRLRTSALVQVGRDREAAGGAPSAAHPGTSGAADETLNIVIDAGPDFRTQMLAAKVTRLDAILLTHEHKDHTGGIDDVRAFNYFEHRPTDIYATERVEQALKQEYAYAFAEHPSPGAPEITLHTIGEGPFRVGQMADGPVPANIPPDLVAEARIMAETPLSVEVIPVKGLHMHRPVTGFRIGRLAYLTDFNHIDEAEIEKLKGVDVLVVNALGHRIHPSHFNLEQAIELSCRVGAPRTYLTHMSHRIGLYADIEPTLPEGVRLAYDNLTITV
jgi:phosphoribosyl 1,2-cyclic phosphate phosphodiesterase